MREDSVVHRTEKGECPSRQREYTDEFLSVSFYKSIFLISERRADFIFTMLISSGRI